MSEPLVVATDLVKQFPYAVARSATRGRDGECCGGRSTSPSTGARPLGSSANPAVASPPSVAPSFACEEPTSGTITFDGTDITHVKGQKLKPFRSRAQFIFQDPYSSLDPRTQVGNSISEGLRAPRSLEQGRTPGAGQTRCSRLVGLQRSHAGRYPHEFSGGQRQRIGLARALILEARLRGC